MKRKSIYIILLTGILSCQVQQKEQTTEAVSKSQSIERYKTINQQLNATENCIICDSTQIFKTVEDVLN
ncbi:MAG: hypothetical protein JXR61_13880, partial [Prolixibacteraceae bacterium]|nr:hypothetical protein [Prolixibacteraceae bacterium]